MNRIEESQDRARRRLAVAIKARRPAPGADLAAGRGRAWINGREVAPDARFDQLRVSFD